MIWRQIWKYFYSLKRHLIAKEIIRVFLQLKCQRFNLNNTIQSYFSNALEIFLCRVITWKECSGCVIECMQFSKNIIRRTHQNESIITFGVELFAHLFSLYYYWVSTFIIFEFDGIFTNPIGNVIINQHKEPLNRKTKFIWIR